MMANILSAGHGLQMTKLSNINWRLTFQNLFFEASLPSLLTRGMLYLLILLYIYFNEYGLFEVLNGTANHGTLQEMLAPILNIYSYKAGVTDFFMLIFLIEGIINLLISDRAKHERLVYRIGRKDNFTKTYFLFNLKLILKSCAMIYSIFIVSCLLLITANFIVSGKFMLMDTSYFDFGFRDPLYDKYLLSHYYPQYMLFLVWIPGFINYIILFFMQLRFDSIIKNKILLLLFTVFLYLFIPMFIDRELIFLTPTFGIFSMCASSYTQILAWLSLLGWGIVLFIFLKLIGKLGYNDF